MNDQYEVKNKEINHCIKLTIPPNYY